MKTRLDTHLNVRAYSYCETEGHSTTEIGQAMHLGDSTNRG
jgi:hypothetical protein